MPNTALASYLSETGMKPAELAEEVNKAVGSITGRRGTVTDRTVRRWLSGKNTWPHEKQRLALEIVTERKPEDLGFIRRERPVGHAPPQQEDPMRRRTLFTATAGTAAAVPLTARATPRRRIGRADVERLTSQLADVVASDDRHGGTEAVESRAVRLTTQTLALQQNASASQRVRGQLYSLAAAFVSSAMWAAIDGHRLQAAQQHLNQAVTLAGLSGDPAIRFRVWGHAGALYRHLGRTSDALAADAAARAVSITRRDPLYASLAHARTAVHQADAGERSAARRSLMHAQDALDRAEPNAPRPPWIAFYDQAELELLALAAHCALGEWAQAEAHAHHNLALLRPHLKRNRALALARLAHAQLGQDALEPAVASALAVPPEARYGRIERVLQDFGTRLAALAPNTPEARHWAEVEAARRKDQPL